MNVFSGEGINSIYLRVLKCFLGSGDDFVDSRCGRVLDLGASTLEFLNPGHQMLFLKGRKYNPFFALVESAWVLSGKNTLEELQVVLSSYSSYSNNGKTLDGAYGYRAKKQYGFDQIERVIDVLSSNPESRRAVITLYGPQDLNNDGSLDVPCNTAVYIKVRGDSLNLTVVNRSNDVFLGVPYNVFVFGVLQKYIAKRLRLNVGVQTHFTDSLHLYEKDIESVKWIVSQNDSIQVETWERDFPVSQDFFDGVFDDFEAISRLSLDDINSSYIKNIVKAYLYKKNCGSGKLISQLPEDAFSHSAKLWLDSLNR